jgi:hypothetical protein
VKKATFVLVPGLAVLIAAAASVRGGSREELPAPSRKPATAAARKAVAPEPAPSAVPSSSGTLAFQLLSALKEQRELRERMTTVPLTDAERRRLLALDAEAPARAEALSTLVRANPEAWRDVIAVLSVTDDGQSARALVTGLRGSIDPAAESLWTGTLLTGGRAEDRRLALVALAQRSSPEVVLAVSTAAQGDPDGGVRAEAMTTLAGLCRGAMTEDRSRMIRETLRQSTATEPDPALREQAAGLVKEVNRQSAPYRPAPARSLFSRGSRPRPASSNP